MPSHKHKPTRTTGILIGRWAPDLDFSSGIDEARAAASATWSLGRHSSRPGAGSALLLVVRAGVTLAP